MRLKVWLSYIFFIFITIVVAMVLSLIMIEPSAENAGIRAFYEEPKNQIDAVFVGPSSSYTTFLPSIAYHKYGITTAVYPIFGMVTEQYIPVVKEVMKYQTPKVLFLVVDAIDPLPSRPSNTERVGLKSISYVRPSINKIKMIQAYKNELKFSNLEILEYHFPIICFHSKWKNLKRNYYAYDFNPHKGALIDFGTFYQKNLYNDQKMERLPVEKYPNLYIQKLIDAGRNPERSISKKNKERETAIFQYVKNVENLFNYVSTLKNTKVVLLAPPSYINDSNFDRLQYVFYMGKQYGIDSFYMADCEGLNIDLNYDFLDRGHLNFWGAVKTTDYLSKLLVEKYGLEDKRNDIKYNSWNEEYEFYKNEIKRRYNVDIESGELINSESNN